MPDWLLPPSLLAVAAAATYASRGLGVLLSGRIDPASPLFAWIGLVTYWAVGHTSELFPRP